MPQFLLKMDNFFNFSFVLMSENPKKWQIMKVTPLWKIVAEHLTKSLIKRCQVKEQVQDIGTYQISKKPFFISFWNKTTKN